MHTILRVVCCFIIIAVLAGCSSKLQRATAKAQQRGFSSQLLATKQFQLISFYHLSAGAKEANVYIEGDGLAWLTAYRLSTNPTPSDDLVLELALSDPALNVIYIARPCQYVPFELNPHCSGKYWSSHRFAPEVLASLSAALDQIKQYYPKIKYHLIGYSGGGAIAALLAASRTDVLSLTTLAGNLDHVAVNQYHQVSQMPESLNALDQAKQLIKLPQRHFVGIKDTVVPPFIAKRFLAKMNAPSCSVIIPLDVNHHSGWRQVWLTWANAGWACQP